MGFTLAEAQWLVKFMRSLPGQAAPSPENEEEQYAQMMEMQAMQAQAQAQAQVQAYSDYPIEEYDEYW